MNWMKLVPGSADTINSLVHSQPECAWSIRLCLSWKLQLGQPQPLPTGKIVQLDVWSGMQFRGCGVLSGVVFIHRSVGVTSELTNSIRVENEKNSIRVENEKHNQWHIPTSTSQRFVDANADTTATVSRTCWTSVDASADTTATVSRTCWTSVDASLIVTFTNK